ncbi:MAG TPA: DUF1580 domain-containing protein [Phycisphaerae bacterium]|nr:DUF1580 domain-containing protein [Phycisphaerae bacterium]HRY70439.1 DUF1580 domain-containing protein [Phycisphaerae bacterium]HSA27673.1 DUF1580 domain-containing protein [Phycisphaerae bacterium]
MIDILTEHLIPIRNVPHRLPPRPTGRRVHISAVYRWIQRGVRGVQLETIRIGGTSYTSIEALQRFAERQSRAPTADLVSQAHTTATRRRQIDSAKMAVEAIMAGRRYGQRKAMARNGDETPDSNRASRSAPDASADDGPD